MNKYFTADANCDKHKKTVAGTITRKLTPADCLDLPQMFLFSVWCYLLSFHVYLSYPPAFFLEYHVIKLTFASSYKIHLPCSLFKKAGSGEAEARPRVVWDLKQKINKIKFSKYLHPLQVSASAALLQVSIPSPSTTNSNYAPPSPFRSDNLRFVILLP